MIDVLLHLPHLLPAFAVAGLVGFAVRERRRNERRRAAEQPTLTYLRAARRQAVSAATPAHPAVARLGVALVVPVAGVLMTAAALYTVRLLSREPSRGAMLLHTGVGSSRVDLQACKLEYSIVSPK